MKQPTTQPVISGDKLLLGLQYLQFLASWHATHRPLDHRANAKPFAINPDVTDLLDTHLDHAIDCWQWYGQIAVRTPTRETIEKLIAMMTDTRFYVHAFVTNALEKIATPDHAGRLTETDMDRLRQTVTRFFLALAADEIGEKDLTEDPLPPHAVRC